MRIILSGNAQEKPQKTGLRKASLLNRFDPANAENRDVLQHLVSFPAMLEQGMQAGKNVCATQAKLENILLVGMGSSMGSGELILDLLSQDLCIPVEIVRDFDLPFYAGPKTLVLAFSYGGKTGETLACITKAAQRSTQIIFASKKEKMEVLGPEIKADFIKMPAGYPTALTLGLSLGFFLSALEKTGASKDNFTAKIEESLPGLAAYAEELATRPFSENPAKQIAAYFYKKIPHLLGVMNITRGLGYYWELQLNELAKISAHVSIFPAFSHTEIHSLGTYGLSKRELGNYAPVFFRDLTEPEKVKSRIQRVQEIMEERGLKYLEISAEEGTKIEKGLFLSLLANYASFYLAIIREVNPCAHGVKIDLT